MFYFFTKLNTKRKLYIYVLLSLIIITVSLHSRSSYVLKEVESAYTYIIIRQSGNIRTMSFRNSDLIYDESAINIINPLYIPMKYQRAMFASFIFKKEIDNLLMLGLGGGTVVTNLVQYSQDINIDVSEIDPKVIELAREYFLYNDKDNSKITTTTLDGRVFINRSRKKYDVIMLDAYRGGYIPFHLKTKEFYEEVKKALKPDGIVVANLHNIKKSYDHDRKTIDTVFNNSYVFKTGGNSIVVATMNNNKLSISDILNKAKIAQKQYKFTFNLVNIAKKYLNYKDYDKDVEIFTDDYAPVNLLDTKK